MFLRALLDKAAEALVRGEKVTINGIGTFAPSPLSPEAVLWAPDASLAEAVNEPFAAFEPVRLAPGVTEEALAETTASPDRAGENVDTPAEDNAPEADKVHETQEETPVNVAAPEVTTVDASLEKETQPEPAPDTTVEPVAHVMHAANTESNSVDDMPALTDGEVVDEAAAVVDATPEVMTGGNPQPAEQPAVTERPMAAVRTWVEEDKEPVAEPETVVVYRERSGLNPWLMLLIGVLVGLAMGYFLGISFGYLGGGDTSPEDLEAEEEMLDSVADDGFITEIGEAAYVAAVAPEPEEHPAAPVAQTAQASPKATPAAPQTPKVVTDTVTGRRYLTTMARKYYGNNCFWVYIYEENADKISNPDLIRPGTVVVIPPASKYGIDASDPASVRRATAKIGEIESRMKRRR